jgi:HEAT repeat protein
VNDEAPIGLSSRDHDRMGDVQRLAQGGEASTGALVRLLDDPSWVVRRAVVASLARIGLPAVTALCTVLESQRTNEGRIAAAVDALAAAGGDVERAVLDLAQRAPSPAILCDVAQILGRRKSRDAVPILAGWCAHADDNVAVAAIEALGRIGGEAAVLPLVDAVRSENFFRAFPAISVLGQTGDPRAVAALAERLAEPTYTLEAAAALGRTGQLTAVAPLTQYALGDVASTRAAARALSELRARHFERFGDPEGIPRAFALLATEETVARSQVALKGANVEETVALASVLGWKHDTAGVAALVSLLEADNAASREAFKALRHLAQDAETLIREAVRTGDSARRMRLLPLLGARRSVVAELVECLTDPEPAVRAAACDALGRIGDPSAVVNLFALIGEPDVRVAQAALGAIQSLGSDQAKQHALAAARSNEPRTRRAALRIISYFGYSEGLGALLEAIEDADERIRDAAASGLVLLEEPRAQAALIGSSTHASAHTRASAMRSLSLAIATPDVIDALLRGLNDGDAWVRYYACQSLGKLRVTAVAEQVARMVDDEAGQVRVAAVEAIAKLGGPRALALLERASRQTDADVRRAALVGLGELRRPDALPILLRAAEANDATTRLVAISALAESTAPEATLALGRAGADIDPRVRDVAFSLLSTRPGPQATHWLVEQLARDEDRERALTGLASSVDGRIEGVLSALEGADATLARWLIEALSRMRRANATAAIEAALHLDNVDARRAAATALAALGTTAARQALGEAAAMDADSEVRRIASGLG